MNAPTAVVGFAIGYAVAMFVSAPTWFAHQDMKAEAVKRGAAEWVVDPANGETTFKWKEVEP